MARWVAVFHTAWWATSLRAGSSTLAGSLEATSSPAGSGGDRGVSVLLDPATNGRVLLANGKGEVREVDFTDLSARVVSEDASKWQAPGQGIEKHLKDLASAHQLHGQYVVVDNYQHNGRNLGRAYYDVAKDRMMFTDTSEVKAGKAQLGAVIGDYAYFHDDESAAAWRVDIASGKVDAQYTPWFNDSVGKISRLWAEGGEVYLARRYQMKDGEGELGYRLVGDRMELVSAVGDDALLKLLARTRQHGDAFVNLLPRLRKLQHAARNSGYKVGGRLIHPVPAALSRCMEPMRRAWRIVMDTHRRWHADQAESGTAG
ncbi:TcdA/TcdB pore-forming domain-containing protein [Pseudomonas baetica]|uniref:TcdA/TcdB pore-forming domain-containing protein n=1 Tax=Pseudomonas baetica TaxID=674054 RepID=UPI001FC96FA7|nr:TcdA/TcdB pore-forming domain-containing protein [Pseudomonas baetica]